LPQEYGSGRQRLGIEPTPSPAADAPSSADAPSLKEYLQFGRLMGERVQDVQQRLELNSAAVVVDEESLSYLDEWQGEQMAAYEMFEALVDDELRTKSAQTNATLMKNKNRRAISPRALGRFVEREFGNAPRAVTAGERKLAKNKGRLGALGAGSGVGAAAEAFELVGAARPGDGTVEPALAGKPARQGDDLDEQVSGMGGYGIDNIDFSSLVNWRRQRTPFSLSFLLFLVLWRGLFYLYSTVCLSSDDTSLPGPSNSSASLRRPSAPSSVMSLSSDNVINLIFTSFTSVSGMPSIFSGTSAIKRTKNR
jgi:hypothetical protein